jgi:hypothetical protein
MAAMDEGVPIQIALGKVIRAMGVIEGAHADRGGEDASRDAASRQRPTAGSD